MVDALKAFGIAMIIFITVLAFILALAGGGMNLNSWYGGMACLAFVFNLVIGIGVGREL